MSTVRVKSTAYTPSSANPCVSFEGKWELNAERTRGNPDLCMQILGRSYWERTMLPKAYEIQLVRQYEQGGVHTIQKNVIYRVYLPFDKTFEKPYETSLSLDSVKYTHPNDEKGFGKSTSVGKWVSPNSYRIKWQMRIGKRPIIMNITRTLCEETEHYPQTTSVRMDIAQYVATEDDTAESGGEEKDLVIDTTTECTRATSTKYYERDMAMSSGEQKSLVAMEIGKAHMRYAYPR